MATRLGKKLTDVRKNGLLWWLRPDGKTAWPPAWARSSPTCARMACSGGCAQTARQHGHPLGQEAHRRAQEWPALVAAPRRQDSMATRLGKKLTDVRKNGLLWWLRPDG